MTWHDLALGCIELSATLEFSSVLALSGYHDRFAFHSLDICENLYKDMKEAREKITDREVYGLMLGDIVHENMSLYPSYTAGIRNSGVQMFNVIGNHDHDRSVVGNEPLAEEPFEATFGSRYYSFELGQTLFVALDNIDYTSYDEYDLGVSREQLRWLRRLMRQTPKNKRVAVAMHAPVFNRREGEVIPYAKRIMRIVGNRELHFITGHSHRHAVG